MHRKFIYGLLLLSFVFVSRLAYSANAFYGPAFESEHLYRIALRVRPAPYLTIQQVMVAILRANPDAFAYHNINGLKAGYRLHIPGLLAMSKIKANTATRIVSEQNYLWNKGLMDKDPAASKLNKSKARSSKSQTKTTKPVDTVHKSVTPKIEPTVLTLTNPVPETNKMASVDATQAYVSALDDKITGFISETKKFEQQTSEQVIHLERQNHSLEAKINQLNEQLKAVTYQFIQLNAKNQSKNYPAIFENIKAHALPLLAGFLALVVLSYLLARTFRSKPMIDEAKTDEYDYMNSNESIPSKLDLARVYIDMGDFSAAKNLLKEVLSKGNKEQQQGANELLLNMNH